MYYNHYMYYVLAAWSVSAFHLVVPVLYYIFYQLYTNTKKEKKLKNKHAFVKRKEERQQRNVMLEPAGLALVVVNWSIV